MNKKQKIKEIENKMRQLADELETVRNEYTSPKSLMRKGAEQAIKLTDIEWAKIKSNVSFYDKDGAIYKLALQALKNCRPKQTNKQ